MGSSDGRLQRLPWSKTRRGKASVVQGPFGGLELENTEAYAGLCGLTGVCSPQVELHSFPDPTP